MLCCGASSARRVWSAPDLPGGIVDLGSVLVLRILLGLLVVAHGLVHLAVWIPAPSDDAPMQTARSWLLGDVRPLAVGLAVTAAVLLTAGGIAVLAGAGWWAWLVIVGSATSVLLIALTFTPWWLFGLAIDAALLVWAVRTVR